ncbi:MAG TPA: fumarylacetoacetate hydrolase family protein [Methylomirabilota bacterium]|nr:fumarylacetoacetate hydrolase family protein [Methylomirabilota bacterium]
MSAHRICRFQIGNGLARIGLVREKDLLDLSGAGVNTLSELLEERDIPAHLETLIQAGLDAHSLERITFLAPVDQQEVWAAGVTYLRSKKARMEESDFSASAYDRVYEAPRPEIFFKSLPHKVVGPGGLVGIRKDATWNVPEPELALVLNSRGALVGFTIGNDMSSRDIEGENLLYLPQAKTYNKSCALGPWITLGTEEDARSWQIEVEIRRDSNTVFSGSTAVSQIKRSFRELIDYLFRSQEFPQGAVLLTGTGIVPADDFTLKPADAVRIRISGIGELQNRVVEV